jgi:hypothetical protein
MSHAHPSALGRGWLRRIFKRTVEACLKAKIATPEVVHMGVVAGEIDRRLDQGTWLNCDRIGWTR